MFFTVGYPWNEKSGKDFEKSLKASSQHQYCVGNPRVSALTLFYTGVSNPYFFSMKIKSLQKKHF